MADDAADKVSAEDVQNEETEVSPLPCSNDDRTASVADFMKAPLASLGNWLDVMTNEEALVTELPVHGTKSVEQVINEPYEHRCSIVLGADMMYCQVPNSGPYNVIVFGIPETATEAEVYMLFGGSRSIETYLYRSDISEMLIKFREHRHVVSALLKQDMNFKEKPLRLGIVLINEQIDEFHRHNQKHHDFDMEMVPFSGAFDRSHVCEDDGQVTGLYDDIGSIAETESISSASQFSKVFNNDVRSSNSFGFYNCSTLPNIRNRKGSTASMQSLKSVPERSQRFYRNEEYNRPYSNNVLPPVLSQSEESNAIDNIKRTVSVSDAPLSSDIRSSSTSLASSSVASKKSRINPFGDAKYVDQSKKMLQILEQKENEKQNKNFVAPFPVDFTQPPPNYQPSLVESVQRPEINPKTIRIEKRPENVPPAALNGQVWVNKNILIPPSFRIPTMRTALQSQNNVAIDSEAIDVTKPPPPVPQAYRSDKPEVKRIGRQFVNKSLSHGNNYHSSGSQYKNGQEYHHNRPYRNNHALPPTGPINRKKSSSMDQTSKSAADVVVEQKSQSAPLAQENVVHTSSGKSTPDNASKRPNSANSAMSFVTAESEVSSAELPGVPGSSDNIPERINELTEEQRRHSWEGQKSPARKRERVPFKSRFDKKKDQTTTSNASIRKSSDTFSRSSSRSTPQYQSASSVFLDANEEITPPEVQETKESTPVKEEPKKEIKAVTKARNCFDKRDRSLPLSRPHTASNDKTSNPLNVDSLKTETLSAPPTPSGSSKKRKDKAKGKVHQNLSNNKFRVLADNFEI